jgi:hypothetical protein
MLTAHPLFLKGTIMLRMNTRQFDDFSADTAMFLTVVDPEFRQDMADRFGTVGDIDAIEKILPPDTTFRDLLREDLESIEILACVSTCSKGPITLICDGTTK